MADFTLFFRANGTVDLDPPPGTGCNRIQKLAGSFVDFDFVNDSGKAIRKVEFKNWNFGTPSIPCPNPFDSTTFLNLPKGTSSQSRHIIHLPPTMTDHECFKSDLFVDDVKKMDPELDIIPIRDLAKVAAESFTRGLAEIRDFLETTKFQDKIFPQGIFEITVKVQNLFEVTISGRDK